MYEFEKQMTIEFNLHYKSYNTGIGLSNMCKAFIEKKRNELKPQMKYFKTFVPIFPLLYKSLDGGFLLGARKNMNLYGT